MSVGDNKIDQAMTTAGSLISQGHAIQQIQTPYATAVAVQRPRDLALVEKNCMKEAMLVGAGCYYGWGAGKDRIEGPGFDLTKILVRNWGNCAVFPEPIQETATAWIVSHAFVDLETGTTIVRPFRQSKKWKVYGKMDAERKDDVRFQIGVSKSQRNVVLGALPAWLIDKMMDAAKAGVRETLQRYIDKKGIEAARQLAVKALGKHSITQEDIEQKYGKKYGAWDIEVLVLLKGDIRALDSGAESPTELYPKEPVKQETGKNKINPDDMSAGDPKTHQDYTDPKELKIAIANTVTLHNIDQEIFGEWLKQEHKIDSMNDIPDSKLQQVLTALKAAAIDLSKIEAGGELPLGDKKSKGSF